MSASEESEIGTLLHSSEANDSNLDETPFVLVKKGKRREKENEPVEYSPFSVNSFNIEYSLRRERQFNKFFEPRFIRGDAAGGNVCSKGNFQME